MFLASDTSNHLLADVLAGANVGIALFDSGLKLLLCNARYRELFGYTESETRAGTPLTDLVRLTLERQRTPTDQIEQIIAQLPAWHSRGHSYTFNLTSLSGRFVEVHRRRLAEGSLVETATELSEQDRDDPDSGGFDQFAKIARTRMMHALDVMPDGFALYNSDDRLIAYNRKYVEYNPHIADLIMPGAHFETMLRAGMERSGYITHNLSKDDFVEWRLKQHRYPSAPYDLQLADWRWIRIHEKRLEDGGVVGIQSDITELKMREAEILLMSQELRSKNIQFDTALNNMIQGLCMFNAEQTLVVCNRRYLEMYGFSPEVVKPGIKLRDILEYSVSIGNYTREEADRALDERENQANLRRRATVKQRLRDGRVIAVMNEPMTDGGSIATCQDITDLEHHEEKLAAYTRQLESSNRELQDFTRIASHDLQEPLRKIETFGSRLQTRFAEHLPGEATIYIDRMISASSRIRQLIEAVQGYSRVSRKLTPFEAVDLNILVAEVLSDLQIKIEETGAKIVVGELPAIDADAIHLGLLLQNLIGNSLKFVRPDITPEIRIEAEIFTINPSVGIDRSMCRLTIADNGIGFDNAFRHQIFTIFQRLHRNSEYEGTGVGLATCRKVVERHGGTIEADGKAGEGAIFTVTLPTEPLTPENA